MLVLLLASSSECLSPFSSRLSLSSHRSNQHFVHNHTLDFLLFLPGTSSTVTSLMSLAILSISRSIRLRAQQTFHQSESGTPDSISGSLCLSRSKRFRILLGQHLTFNFILIVCKHKVIVTCHLWHHGRVLCLPC